jgi:hypothetical protein
VSSQSSASRSNPLATATVHLTLFALGVLLGLYSAMLSGRGPRAVEHIFTVGVGIAIVGNVVAVILGRVAGGRFGGITPLVGWLFAVYGCSIARPNGSFLLPGGGDLKVPTLLFQILGALAGAAAIMVKPPRRWRGTAS